MTLQHLGRVPFGATGSRNGSADDGAEEVPDGMDTTAHTTQHADRAGRGPKAETASEALADRVKIPLHEGTVRRITIRHDEGHAVIEIPVTAGVVAAVVAPVVHGVAAIAGLPSSWQIEIDRAPAGTPATDRAGTSTMPASAA